MLEYYPLYLNRVHYHVGILSMLGYYPLDIWLTWTISRVLSTVDAVFHFYKRCFCIFSKSRDRVLRFEAVAGVELIIILSTIRSQQTNMWTG